MNIAKNIKLIAVVILALIASLILIAPVNAQEENVEEEEAVTTQEEESQNDASYTFTAQPGDSYSEIARKTTQIYGIETETNLSGEQIMFVETNLTIAAGSPELNVGQEVTISQSLVKEWVDQALNLSEDELSLWTKYAEVADFNTDSIGEPAE